MLYLKPWVEVWICDQRSVEECTNPEWCPWSWQPQYKHIIAQLPLSSLLWIWLFCLQEEKLTCQISPWCMWTQFTSYFHMFFFKSFLTRPCINPFLFALSSDFWRLCTSTSGICINAIGNSYLHWIMKQTFLWTIYLVNAWAPDKT